MFDGVKALRVHKASSAAAPRPRSLSTAKGASGLRLRVFNQSLQAFTGINERLVLAVCLLCIRLCVCGRAGTVNLWEPIKRSAPLIVAPLAPREPRPRRYRLFANQNQRRVSFFFFLPFSNHLFLYLFPYFTRLEQQELCAGPRRLQRASEGGAYS